MLMCLILAFYDKSVLALKSGASIEALLNMPSREKIGRFKYTNEADCAKAYEDILAELESEVNSALENTER